MSEQSTGKTVYYTYDEENPPSLSAEEREHLDAMKDEDIDFSDIPRQTNIKNWTRPGLFGGPVGRLRLQALKEKVLLLDEDVVDLLKRAGNPTPEQLNAILREYAQSHVSERQPATA